MCTGWGGHCLCLSILKNTIQKRLLDRLGRTVLTSGHLEMFSCHRSVSADWAVKAGKRRGGFLTTVRPSLEKHARWVHMRYFWDFQARHRRDLWSLSSQAVRKPRRVEELLAQRVGPCFTLDGHTAAQTAGCLLSVWDGAVVTRQRARSCVERLGTCAAWQPSLRASG